MPIARIANTDSEKVDSAKSGILPVLPSGHEIRVSPFIFHSDRPLPAGHQVLSSSADLRDSVCKELKITPPRGIILVYIFGEKGSFDHYLKKRYPNLPARRAFFMAQSRPGSRDEDLVVLTWWSDRLEQDLRHELTHALIHTAIPEIPLWLDEGLAEYFELEAFPTMAEERRRQALLDFTSLNRPDISRLEGLRNIQEMGREEYREAWCWTRWMLNGSPEARPLLLSYLNDLRGSQKTKLSHKLLQIIPDSKERMISHAQKPIVKMQP